MVKLKSLQLEDFLTGEEIEKFHKEWIEVTKPSPSKKSYSSRLVLVTPYEAHCAIPFISKPWQFEDKSVFRAKVFQRQLRKVNPYFNAPYYLPPIWHPAHYQAVFEQIGHHRLGFDIENYHRYKVIEKPALDIVEPIFWSRGNGHVSVIGLGKIRKGSEEKTYAKFCAIFYDDIKNVELASVSTMCQISLRAYVQAYQDLQQKKQDSQERLQNLILDQERQHKSLTHPRTDIPNDDKLAQELIQKCQDGTITLPELDDYFSLYDIPKTKK